eukprot:Amastigsp_a342338_7.p1 type:complete len:319 gc:universal Amastigsp_a342338_7:959-3(-)
MPPWLCGAWTLVALALCVAATEPTDPGLEKEPRQSYIDSIAGLEPIDESLVNFGGCSRSLSAVARAIIESHLAQELESMGYGLPLHCPLHRNHSIFEPYEVAKYKDNEWLWRCELCGKEFSGEQYIDAHMARRHSKALSGQGTVCLADYCDILHCDALALEYGYLDVVIPKTSCGSACLESRRRLCLALAARCFEPPPALRGDAVAKRAYTSFERHFVTEFCDTIGHHFSHVADSVRRSREQPRRFGDAWQLRPSLAGVAMIVGTGIAIAWLGLQCLSAAELAHVAPLRPSRGFGWAESARWLCSRWFRGRRAVVKRE